VSQRERVLAIVLLVVIFIGGGGLVGYLFYYRSLNSANLRLQKYQQDVKANEDKLKDIEGSLPRLQQFKKLSLPGQDLVKSQREYAAEISRLLRVAEFAPGNFTVNSKPIEKRETVPAAKRLPYTRLYFDIVDARGDLNSIVSFLDSFYRLPLLHRIRNMSIVRQATPNQPGVSSRDQQPNQLVFNATIEALALDNAEKRETLLPKDTKPPERLAHTKEQYASIAGRNIFYGPPQRERDDTPREKPSVVDVTEFVVLDEITHDPDKGVQASLYDAFNNYKYFIKQLSDGSFLISTYYYIKDTKKRLNVGEELEIQGDTGETQVTFKVARIDATDIVLQDSETGKYYRMHIGFNLKEAKGLSSTEAKEMGLKVADEKKPAGAGDKKGEEGKKAPPPKPDKDEGK